MTVLTIQPKFPGRAPASAKPHVVFEIKRRLKLWVVLQDGVYCGSFPEEAGAEVAVRRQIQAIERSGGHAELRLGDTDPAKA